MYRNKSYDIFMELEPETVAQKLSNLKQRMKKNDSQLTPNNKSDNKHENILNAPKKAKVSLIFFSLIEEK